MKNLFVGILVISCVLNFLTFVKAEELQKTEYTIGVDDLLEINILQPEKLETTLTVSPDGTITFPYIGNVQVETMTLARVQDEIQERLADGYMKYPIVSVSLKESRSRKFSVYGEVIKPGAYPIEENITVFKAISIAGGFTKYGSSSRVKILRLKTNGPGYENIKIKMNAIKNGSSKDDILLKPGDIVVVSEGIF